MLIKNVSDLVLKYYLFPDKADEMAKLLEKNNVANKYANITNEKELAKVLTHDLRSINNDKHLDVIFDPIRVSELNEKKLKNEKNKTSDRQIANHRSINYGFKEVKILDGNIGYLKLRYFIDTAYAGDTAVAAMAFLANTDAIIIDLRKNGGGSPSMLQLLISYFFDPKPIHLSSYYWRETDDYTQTWTLPFVPGKRLPKINLYLLTSKNTFSAAESFCYALQNLKRATLIGETTGGGAHRCDSYVATDSCFICMPISQSLSPITNTNWEGVGVIPEVKFPNTKEDALEVAHKAALEDLKA